MGWHIKESTHTAKENETQPNSVCESVCKSYGHTPIVYVAAGGLLTIELFGRLFGREGSRQVSAGFPDNKDPHIDVD